MKRDSYNLSKRVKATTTTSHFEIQNLQFLGDINSYTPRKVCSQDIVVVEYNNSSSSYQLSIKFISNFTELFIKYLVKLFNLY